MRLSEMLRIYIAAKGMQQKAIAAEIGISETTLCRFLSGSRSPDAAGFAKVLAWAIADEIRRGA